MTSPRPPSPTARPLDLEITVISAKHLKNVNWRHGELKPYAVAYLEPDRRYATKPDDAGSVRPVWNERLVLPLPSSLQRESLLLTLDVFHSKPSETPKPLIGTVRLTLKGLIDLEDFSGTPTPIRTLDLLRPSGRPQGKIRIKLAIRRRSCAPEPNYSFPPAFPASGFYYSAPPPLPRDYRPFSSPSPFNRPIPLHPSQYSYGNYSNPYSGYYSAAVSYYSAPPPPVDAAPPARSPYYDGGSGFGVGPSAPVDYSSATSYEQKPKGGKMGMGAGLAVGAVAGALGGLVLEEGLKYEEGKIAGMVEGDLAGREDYGDYRSDY